MSTLQYILVITSAYIVCHGITALVVTPIQSAYLSEVTIFASLVYLPHGVRMLATWLWGWKAFFPLFLGGLLSEFIFSPEHGQAFVSERLHLSVAVGAASAPLAFELMRLLGRNVYARRNRAMNWKCLLFVGAIASVINSIGQSVVFSQEILPEHAARVLVIYAVGDLIGLFVSMLALMLIFRWIRLGQTTN